MPFDALGRILLIVGGVIVVFGLLLILIGRVPFFGRLPGDLTIQTDGFSCFFPVTTMVILSIILTILLNVILRLLSK